MDDQTEALAPLLNLQLAEWRGLPSLTVRDLTARFGPPTASTVVELGYHPADRTTYSSDAPSRGIVAYARGDEVVMIEAQSVPEDLPLSDLPDPDATLSQEIHISGAFAHEYLYAERGLLVTVAQDLAPPRALRVVRVRGIGPLPPGTTTLGPDFYRRLDSRTKY